MRIFNLQIMIIVYISVTLFKVMITIHLMVLFFTTATVKFISLLL